MRHRKRYRKLNRTPSHRRAMLANMATSLIYEERIQTTEAKAKELRPFVEKLITKAKPSGEETYVHRRRLVARVIRDKKAAKKLFDEIGPRYAERPGGYTRIIKLGRRLGDNAPTALIELVRESV